MILAKILAVMSPVPVITLAAVEPATQTSIVNTVTTLISTGGLVALAWIAYKQAQLSKENRSIKETVTKLEVNTNGLNEKLMAATIKENLAVGKAVGVAEAEQKAAVAAVAHAAGVTEGKAAEQPKL